MKTIKNISLECPCCNQLVKVRDTPLEEKFSSIRTQGWMQKKERTQYDLVKDYIDAYFTGDNSRTCQNIWACKKCLKKGKAARADTSKQNYGLGGPISYYIDLTRACRRGCSYCGGSFPFTISEQKYWYEELKFNIDSSPSACPEYRKELRLMKANHKKLGFLINKKNKDVKDLEEIRDIYIQLDLLEKAKIINSQIKNRRK